MRISVTVCLGIGALLTAAAGNAEPTPLIPPDAQLETVTAGYQFTEGPALAPDGSIYFTDIPNNAIHRYDPATGQTTLFTDDSGGANGLAFSFDLLHACAGKVREIHIYGPKKLDWEEWPGLNDSPDLRLGLYKGKQFNSPNDLAFTSESFFFTDPRYGSREGIELAGEWVFAAWPSEDRTRIDSPRMTILPVIQDLVRPNGIGVSPDEITLYVNDNGDQKIWAYEILEPGKLGEARLLNDLADLGGPDGMAVGPHGRIYTTIYGKGVLILSPEGERLGFIETGPQTTNCCFGADGKTLYVTAENSLKRIRLNPDAE